jgi:hypothetical protein
MYTIVLDVLHTLIHLVFTKLLLSEYYYFHFSDEESEVQRG